ncbi:nitroreductase [Paenibacillus oenotherae]|uniref:Putative NAD(P)H nitroreductase n=1 Tax=Paenibacillus oenotherae TaxID=1435645 RepID=A0ABS7D0J6_9BACL|nr:nitroreductase [Paenibacillus oenotherae]MBW7473371.1 nitroreductase [Paenibacillus oenotherae]
MKANNGYIGGPAAAVIKARRTIRQFKSDPVSMELLMQLLNVAVWAPNHGVREPWRFILYKNEARTELAEAMLEALSAAEREQYGDGKRNYFNHIPLHLLVVMKEDPRPRQWEEDYAAVCCWIQNFQLAAWEEGIGVVWKTNPFIYDPRFRARTGVAAGEKIVGLLHIGYPELIPEPRPRTDAAHYLTIRDTRSAH